MEARSEGMVPSRNVMAEVVGWEFPDEVVVLGGHSDSWDVGQGAMDDAGGVVAAWEAVRLMKESGPSSSPHGPGGGVDRRGGGNLRWTGLCRGA